MGLRVRCRVAIVLVVGSGACGGHSDDGHFSMDAHVGPCATAERELDCGLTPEHDGGNDAQLVDDGGVPDAEHTPDSSGHTYAANGWTDLRGPMLGDGSEPESGLRKPLAATL